MCKLSLLVQAKERFGVENLELKIVPCIRIVAVLKIGIVLKMSVVQIRHQITLKLVKLTDLYTVKSHF